MNILWSDTKLCSLIFFKERYLVFYFINLQKRKKLFLIKISYFHSSNHVVFLQQHLLWNKIFLWSSEWWKLILKYKVLKNIGCRTSSTLYVIIKLFNISLRKELILKILSMKNTALVLHLHHLFLAAFMEQFIVTQSILRFYSRRNQKHNQKCPLCC